MTPRADPTSACNCSFVCDRSAVHFLSVSFLITAPHPVLPVSQHGNKLSGGGGNHPERRNRTAAVQHFVSCAEVSNIIVDVATTIRIVRIHAGSTRKVSGGDIKGFTKAEAVPSIDFRGTLGVGFNPPRGFVDSNADS